MHTNIRKWGNSVGVIIPAGVLAKAGMSLGDTIELEVQDGQITLKQASPKYSLEGLLKASPPETFALDEEDKAWLQDSPLGKELD